MTLHLLLTIPGVARERDQLFVCPGSFLNSIALLNPQRKTAWVKVEWQMIWYITRKKDSNLL